MLYTSHHRLGFSGALPIISHSSLKAIGIIILLLLQLYIQPGKKYIVILYILQRLSAASLPVLFVFVVCDNLI